MKRSGQCGLQVANGSVDPQRLGDLAGLAFFDEDSAGHASGFDVRVKAGQAVADLPGRGSEVRVDSIINRSRSKACDRVELEAVRKPLNRQRERDNNSSLCTMVK